ncbi:MAG: ATP-dependent Clp protease ATP-binding subunit [Ruminococcaceae bacterium]|nr:ATP-dependent Clp protease ATP-binding subunit [Oscillospiraceae bacterium]
MIKLSKELNELLEQAKIISINLGHSFVGSEHLLLAILSNKKLSMAIRQELPNSKDLTYAKTMSEVVKIRGRGERGAISIQKLSSDLHSIIENSFKYAFEKGEKEIKISHVLEAIKKEENCLAMKLINIKFGKERSIEMHYEPLKSEKALTYDTIKQLRSETPILNNFSKDVTLMACENMLDPVIGRKEEINRVLEILLRKNKNNPCLIGYPGVGKSAIVDALAMKIVKGEVPPQLQEKRVVSLDISSLLAGARYRGDFEERIKKIMDEVRKTKNVILMIDELHNIANTSTGEGSLDAGNILKPELARGDISIIGATTVDEYRKFIEKDAALDRRFQKVLVKEPSREESISILRGLKERYESFHGVRITESAIMKAVDLSIKNVYNKYLPDKALDLIDESASRAKILQKKLVDDEDIENTLNRYKNKKQDLLIKENVDKLKQNLNKKVLGQEKAIEKLIETYTNFEVQKTRFTSINCPCIFFGGPTGCGKTSLAKSFSDEVFGEGTLLKIDMAEYSEKHSISKLIGSPPGYVGYEESGILVNEVSKNPFRVIVFDEIEKSHPDVLKVLLKILDDGELLDRRSRAVDFKNTFIILTSNLGFDKNTTTSGFLKIEKEEKLIEIKTFLGNAVFSRIDEIILFEKPNLKDGKKICEYLILKSVESCKKVGLDVSVENDVIDLILEKSDIKNLGYRNLWKNYFKLVEKTINEEIINSCHTHKQLSIYVDENGEINIRRQFNKLNLENNQLSMYNRQKCVD